MRRPSSLKSQPFSQQALHPVLQAMLGNLDVQLDEELARYRRQSGRRGGQTGLPRQSPLPQAQVDLTQPRVTEKTIAPIPVPTKTGRLHAVAAPSAMESAVETEATAAPSHKQVAYGTSVGAAGLSLAIASGLGSAPDDSYAPPPQSAMLNLHPQTDDELVEPLGAASADLSAEAGDAWGSDDYLESSEHLLQSLADEEVDLRTSQEPGMLQSLLTPLGIGSMLLLLLSSVTFGYLLMNPSSMSFLGLGANQQPPAPNLATGAQIAGGSGVPGSNAAGQDLLPNLSAQEFPDVNLDTLSTLPKTPAIAPSSTPFTDSSQPQTGSSVAPRISAESSSRPVPSASQSISRASAPTNSSTNSPTNSSRTSQAPASTAQSQRSSRVDTSSQRQPRGAATSGAERSGSSRRPATSGRSPSPSPSSQRVTTQPIQRRPQPAAPTVATAPRTPAVAPSPRPAPDAATPSAAVPTYYYVVMDFSGDRSLEQARQVVGDAFLRNFSEGAKIQFGRFADRDRATALARDLQSQGVSARVYQP